MGPEKPIPYSDEFENAEQYVESLTGFFRSSQLLRTFCGGVHVLDFLNTSPDLFATIVPEDWRMWFKERDIMEILDLLLREELDIFERDSTSQGTWREGPFPPNSLLQYIKEVRKHSLCREPQSVVSDAAGNSIPRRIAVGMNPKKKHEVVHFAQYVDRLTGTVTAAGQRAITHIVDFGSGRNYLGRTLASKPYKKNIIAVESRSHNIEASRDMDTVAKLTQKEQIMRNKKEYRAILRAMVPNANGLPLSESDGNSEATFETTLLKERKLPIKDHQKVESKVSDAEQGTVRYISHRILDGDLKDVIAGAIDNPISSASTPTSHPSLMVISLHSCGNLLHHGLRTLPLNPSVTAVAMIGCCYNLMTERLNSATFKHPSLRSRHSRLLKEANAYDPHGFPMSKRFMTYKMRFHNSTEQPGDRDIEGIRLNITARMMAVQAPANWARDDSAEFFKRHFYRALLQRIFLDHQIVSPVVASSASESSELAQENEKSKDTTLAAVDAGTTPLTVGCVPKPSSASFPSYVHYAVAKILRINSPTSPTDLPQNIRERLTHLSTLPAKYFSAYEETYHSRQHDIAVLWSLMAFSANVIEALIVVDRWLFLCELEDVGPDRAWVEAVWNYAQSPRNLVVVGIRK